MPTHMLKAHEALVEATLGNSAAAWKALEQVPQGVVEGDPTLERIVSRTRRCSSADARGRGSRRPVLRPDCGR